MRLLFDENLSPAITDLLKAEFPGAGHVELTISRGATDSEIWKYSKKNDFTIVSKDNDFRQRAFTLGPPPKIIWLTADYLAVLTCWKNRTGRAILYE